MDKTFCKTAMFNISISQLDQTPRAVVAIATEYANGTVLAWHHHRRAQLLYGAQGVMLVETEQGTWLVPPQHAVWLAPEIEHKVTMLGVTTHSLYIEPEIKVRPSSSCEVLEVSSLLRELLASAVATPLLYDEQTRDGALIGLLLLEINAAQPIPLLLPMPQDAKLKKACQVFIEQPDIKQTTLSWAARHHKSERHFTRWFKQQTGIGFNQWKQQACVVKSLALLVNNMTVMEVALICGYENAAAFATMFKRIMQQPPSSYFSSHRAQ